MIKRRLAFIDKDTFTGLLLIAFPASTDTIATKSISWKNLPFKL